MSYSDKFTEKEIKVFNKIFDLLDSLYKQDNPDCGELDKIYRGFTELLANYNIVEERSENDESLNEDFKPYLMTLREFLNEFDFDVYKSKDDNGEVTYKLRDTQGANLGDIESESFYDIDSIVDRLDIYYNDYIISDVEDNLKDLASHSAGYDILDKWNESHSYKDMYDYLIELQAKYPDASISPLYLNLLYYIINPDKLVDDAEFED